MYTFLLLRSFLLAEEVARFCLIRIELLSFTRLFCKLVKRLKLIVLCIFVDDDSEGRIDFVLSELSYRQLLDYYVN